MLQLNEFILLKAIFNESLHNSVLSKDAGKIQSILDERYTNEIYNGFVSLEPIDTERLYREHHAAIQNDNFDWV